MSTKQNPPLWKTVFAGGVGGVCLTAIGHPLETIKTRMQTGATKRLFSGLFRGVVAPLCGTTPFFVASYLGYRSGLALVHDGDGMPSGSNIVFASLCGAVLATPIRTVVDTVKIVAQNERLSTTEALRKLGLKNLFRSPGATLAVLIPATVSFFYFYEFLHGQLKARTTMEEPYCSLYAGGLAGMAEWALILPLDTMKTRVQAGNVAGLRAATTAIFAAGGIRGFYSGLVPMMVRAFPANAACMGGVSLTTIMLED